MNNASPAACGQPAAGALSVTPFSHYSQSRNANGASAGPGAAAQAEAAANQSQPANVHNHNHGNNAPQPSAATRGGGGRGRSHTADGGPVLLPHSLASAAAGDNPANPPPPPPSGNGAGGGQLPQHQPQSAAEQVQLMVRRGTMDQQMHLPLYKTRLHELFSLIEREMDALYSENCELRAKLEEVQLSDDRQTAAMADEAPDTPTRRGPNFIGTVTPQQMHLAMGGGGESSGGGGGRFGLAPGAQNITAQVGGAKKVSQSRQQKWKSAFKNPSGRLALVKVGANFPESSKHKFVQSFKGHTDGVWHVCATQIAPGSHVLASASADHTARLFLVGEKAAQHSPLVSYSGHSGSVNSVAICQRPTAFAHQLTLLTCSGDRTAHIWRVNLEDVLERKRADKAHQSQENEEEFVQQIVQPLARLSGHSDALTAADWLAGGEQIITASWDRTANLFDTETGKVVKVLSGHDQELTSCSACPTQKLLATASKDFTFRLWDFREPIHSVAVFQGHNDSVTSVVFSPLHHIVSGSDDRTVKVWDLRNMRSPMTAIRLNSAANRISVCNSRNLLAVPLDNRNISVYELNGNRMARIPRSTGKCHHRLVNSCAWLSDHPVNNLITCGFDRQIIGWRVHLPPSAASGAQKT